MEPRPWELITRRIESRPLRLTIASYEISQTNIILIADFVAECRGCDAMCRTQPIHEGACRDRRQIRSLTRDAGLSLTGGGRTASGHFTVIPIDVGYKSDTVPVIVMEIAHETRRSNKIDDCEIVNDNGKAEATSSKRPRILLAAQRILSTRPVPTWQQTIPTAKDTKDTLPCQAFCRAWLTAWKSLGYLLCLYKIGRVVYRFPPTEN